MLVALLRGFQERGNQPPSDVMDWARDRCLSLFDSDKPDDLQAAIELAAALHSRPMQGNVLRILIDRQKPEAVRAAALNGLTAFDLKPLIGTLSLRLADATESLTFREKVAQSLAGDQLPRSPGRPRSLPCRPPPAKLASTVAAGLAGSADGANALLDAVAAGKASPRLLQERPVQVKLDALKRPDIAERVKKLTAGLPPADAAIAALLRKRAPELREGDAGRRRRAKGVREEAAPPATRSAARAPRSARSSTASASAAWTGCSKTCSTRIATSTRHSGRRRFTLKNGQSLTGLVLREEGAVIVLADAQGKEQRVSKEQVAEREVSPLSPMPANWADQIAEKDFHDLMAYLLEQRGK